MSAHTAFLVLFAVYFGAFFFTVLGVYLWCATAPKPKEVKTETIAARRPADTPTSVAGVH